MKKTSIILAGLLLISLIFSSSVFAYAGDGYTIDIPDTYEKEDTDSFTDAEGRNVNIQIGDYDDSLGKDIYTEQNLEELFDVVYGSMEETRETIKNSLLEQKENGETDLTEEEINEYADSFKIEREIEKNITTFSKNNYKAFHMVAEYKMGAKDTIIEQFVVITTTKSYTVTLTTLNLEEYEAKINQEIIDSFTIEDFKDPEESAIEDNAEVTTIGTTSEDTTSSTKTTLFIRIGVIVVVAAIGGLFGLLRRKRK